LSSHRCLGQLGEPARHVGQLFISISESIACSPVDNGGVFFWQVVQMMSRSGTDSPYRPTPNIRGRELANGQQTASFPHAENMPQQPVLRQEESASTRLSLCRNFGPTVASLPDSTTETLNGRAPRRYRIGREVLP
jgi:hypothetical protein